MQTNVVAIERALLFHDRGLICPAEMWNIISDSLEGDDIERELNDLPESVQRSLASQPLDPQYLDQDPFEKRRSIFAWCRHNETAKEI